MRFLSWLVTIPVFLIAVGFAAANRTEVALSFWPLDLAVQVPVFLIGLGALGLGLFAGGLLVWVGSLKLRFEVHSLRRALSREIARQEPEEQGHKHSWRFFK
jgi:uncharacterized integral membrane protein